MVATAFVLVNVEMGRARDVYRKMQEIGNIQNLDGMLLDFLRARGALPQ